MRILRTEYTSTHEISQDWKQFSQRKIRELESTTVITLLNLKRTLLSEVHTPARLRQRGQGFKTSEIGRLKRYNLTVDGDWRWTTTSNLTSVTASIMDRCSEPRTVCRSCAAHFVSAFSATPQFQCAAQNPKNVLQKLASRHAIG